MVFKRNRPSFKYLSQKEKYLLKTFCSKKIIEITLKKTVFLPALKFYTMSQQLKPKYGLVTTTSLVIGCVIGSGIFFKVDDILNAAQGNNLAGLIGWIVVGLSVVLGAVSLAYYAKLLPNEGGLLKYAEYRFGKIPSFFVGWFYMTIYYPILCAVLFTVAGIYIANLLREFIDFTPTFEHYSLIGLMCLFILYFTNVRSPKTGGIIQSASTILKVIPLIIIAGLGIVTFIKGDISPENTLSYAANNLPNNTTLFALASATFIPIAFAFDGWYVATQISGEVKNAKRNLPIALIAGTLIVLFIYVFYYLGIVFKMGSANAIAYKDAYITEFARSLASDTGAILMQLAIIISVLGAGNAILLAGLRVPYQLVNSGNAINFFNVVRIDANWNMPKNSAYFMLTLFIISFFLFYITNTNQFFIDLKFDLSSLPVTFVYVINLCLYVGLFKLIYTNKLGGNKLFKYIIAIIAIFGALIVLYGGITTSNGILYIAICLATLAIGLKVLKRNN